jgi:citronellol/citronellal dehydrogenase
MKSAFRDDLFQGESAVITGGGTGLGREIAMLLASLGAHVVLFGRREEPLAETAQAIVAKGGRASWRAGSIRDHDQVDAFWHFAEEEAGTPAILVNNGGGQFVQPAIDLTPKGWNAVIDTNLTGSWNMMQAAARLWRDRGCGGRIVNVVLDVWRGIPGMAHSVAARGGVIYLSKTLAIEWAPLGIRINCVAPGIIETAALDSYPEGVRNRLRTDANPQRRTVSPGEIAEACVFAVTPRMGFLTGEVITVDGGQQLWGDVWAVEKPEHFRFRG